MIKYLRSCVSFQELKKEISLVIEITNCPHRCKGCHSSELQQDIGVPLTIEVLNSIIFRNSIDKKPLFTCILFMGGEQHEEFKGLLDYIKNNYELKTALFTGAEEVKDDINSLLNYVKTGRYIESLGGLESSITNQKIVELRS